MKNKILCFAKPNVDFSKYGFKNEYKTWSYWHNNTRRMYFDTNTYRVYFNCMTTEVLYTFSKLIKDNVIYFKENSKVHTLQLTDEEYEVIKKMREEN